MCGIAGIFQYKRSSFNNHQYLHWCLQTMKHRGPDSNGVWSNDSYHTAFARLAIRDLSTHGDQPMHSACGRYVISFNGEIYNSDDFKTNLENDGVQFQSTADTEVLLYALIKWKPQEILPKLNGMFAFAFYDKQKNELLLARDRVGIKPLYIGTSEDGLVYSSQYDHIINHPYCKTNSINQEALGMYLNLGYVPEDAGIINNTSLLPHGYYAVVNDSNNLQITQYYAYGAVQQPSTTSLQNVLQKCIKQQLVSDVPLGAFMSGGVDSTLVTSFASKEVSKVKSFTIGMDDKKFDESEAAQEFANYFGTSHNCKFVTVNDLLEKLKDNFAAYTEPFSDYSSVPTLILSSFAREQVTVSLSGDGGDELFWGYPRNVKMLQAIAPYKNSKLARQLTFAKEKLVGTKNRTVLKRHLTSPTYLDYYYKSLFVNGAELWNNQLYKGATGTPFFLQQIQATPADLQDDTLMMNKIRKLEVDLHLQRILLKVDRASMYHSLEVRVPFLDNDMLDYSNTLSYKDCIHQQTGKYNLKQLLAQRTKPELVYKPKQGFVVPLATWMRNELYKEISEKLLDMPVHIANYFNKNILQQMLQLHKDGKQDLSWILWTVYSFVQWDAHQRNKA
jgi:asparagine synthase (glutamine-hydrolysing)